MGKIAFLFSGQGAQYPGMGKSLCEASEAAKAVFDLADSIRSNTSAQCFSGTKEELSRTENTQPCVYCVGLAAAEALKASGIVPDVAAGFSLGEVAALTFCGVLTPEDGFRLVCKRASFMDEAAERTNGGMAAVLKLSDEPQHQTEEDGNASILMTLAPEFLQEPRATLSGVFVGDGGPAAGGWAIETSFPLEKGAVPKPAVFSGALPVAGSGASVTTLTAIVFAFLGGLILNLMPCVFPILSLKILQLIEGYRRGERLLPHGIAFTGGVLVTMGVLAGALLALRGVGMALGWGFQLQSPWVVSLLLVLFVAITINLLGVFEFTAASHLADTRVARSAPRTGAASSFFTGILAVIVASPCTAPFMGAALGYAVTQPAVEAIAVFLSLGLGMALPWLLLCIFPGWSRMLPRPGAWMDVFRKVMAIPMALAVVWLGWVLSKQVSLNGMLLMLAGCGSAAIALWLLGREQWGRGRNRVLMGVTSFLAAGAIAVIATGEFDRAATAQGRGVWQPWSEEAVRASLAEGRPVFVDFTAAWCVTCQANKVAALDRDEVQTAFRDGNVTLLMGDWTNRDPAITDILSRFGRSGVPLYLLYRPDGTVQVLPELLTPGIVLDAVKGGQQ